jgi:hypothetical protein
MSDMAGLLGSRLGGVFSGRAQWELPRYKAGRADSSRPSKTMAEANGISQVNGSNEILRGSVAHFVHNASTR